MSSPLCSYSVAFLPITGVLMISLSFRMSPSHPCDHISAAPLWYRVHVLFSRCRHISIVRSWAHEMRLRPRGLDRVERSSVSDQFVHLGLDRVMRFEHDESSGWIFSIRSMQVHGMDPFLLFLQN
ncbi:unnamed protein product [Brassica rapa]|uniref:Uncharacterized protein n=1 Tax=Brassica campestris TaxID=3711 RepID=A0A8D9CVA6_BRACM|nr:unnamed protein product [Brassica rapa]